MSIIWMIFSGAFVTGVNYMMRKSLDKGGSVLAYLIMQMGLACVTSFFLNPFKLGLPPVSMGCAVLGIFGGLCFGLMMPMLAKALEKGPAGLTFAFLNTSCILPGLILGLLLGKSFGFVLKEEALFGMFIVFLGVFLTGLNSKENRLSSSWMFFCLLTILFHVGLLISIQIKPVLQNETFAQLLQWPYPFTKESGSWFMPISFAVGTIIQLLRLAIEKGKSWTYNGFKYGVVAGILNGAAVLCMEHAFVISNPSQSLILFPLYAVTIIIGTQIWSRLIYKEPIAWVSCILCSLGIFVSCFDWLQ